MPRKIRSKSRLVIPIPQFTKITEIVTHEGGTTAEYLSDQYPAITLRLFSDNVGMGSYKRYYVETQEHDDWSFPTWPQAYQRLVEFNRGKI